MKILFAVSNENVSNRIVDSYKKRYDETVSSKNVFYFNAILRELQRDKTYDSIVISEDLEPFANSNYDVIDKFIVERLQEVTQEIGKIGKDISIIIICTDRRTKTSYVLNKLYEFGIYNALVGADRRIDNVCNLINTPRTQAEAKEYYNIQEDELGNNLDDVSEQEVQNILIHYKKLGKNEDRYTDSFNNIASQYNDKQLRIIIKCLPINVRAVLESECPKYQELVTTQDETEEEKKQKEQIQEQRRLEKEENDRKLQAKIEKERREAEKRALKEQKAAEKAAAKADNNQVQEEVPSIPEAVETFPDTISGNAEPKPEDDVVAPASIPSYSTPKQSSGGSTGIDILDRKKKEPRMTGNVIIPGNMNIRNERKLYSDEELENMASTPREPVAANTQQDQIENASPISMPEEPAIETVDNTLPGMEDAVTEEAVDTVLPGMEDTATEEPVEAVLPGMEDTVTEEPVEAVLPGMEDTTTSEEPVEAVLPGMEDVTTSEEPVEAVLPGMEDVTTSEEPVEAVLPGMEDTVTEEPAEAILPGMEDTVAEEPAEEVLPGLDDVVPAVEPIVGSTIDNAIDSTPEAQTSLEGFESIEENASEEPKKRGRGRPRKYPVEPPKPKGKRGRPRKNPLPEEGIQAEGAELPGFEQVTETIPSMELPEDTNTVGAQEETTYIQTPTGPIAVEKQPEEEKEDLTGFEDVAVSSTYVEKVTADNIEVPEEPIAPAVEEAPTETPAPVEEQKPISQTAAQEAVASVVPVNDLFEEVQTVSLSSSNTVTSQNAQPEVKDTVPEDPFEQTIAQAPVSQMDAVNQVADSTKLQDFASPVQQANDLDSQVSDMRQNMDINSGINSEPTEDNPYQADNNISNADTNTYQVDNAELNSNVGNMTSMDAQIDNLENIELGANPVTSSIDNQFESLDSTTLASQTIEEPLPGMEEPVAVEPVQSSNQELLESLERATQAETQYGEINVEDEEEPENNYEDLYASTVSSKRLEANVDNPENNVTVNQSYQPQSNEFEPAPSQNYGVGPQVDNNPQVEAFVPNDNRMESIQALEENKAYTTGTLSQVLTKDKKIVAFVGAPKSGTSFLINNLATLFSSLGIRTAILDMTKNKNSYFIYTNNDENLRNIAYNSIENLENGIAEGIKVDRNLDVYTAIPNDGKDYTNAEAILSTLAQNESLILVDCDFTTPWGYFANASEIYLVQSMDILTIQPLTAFLRELKTRGLLEQDKLRVVVNKEIKVKGLSSKVIIGGMSFYNDPAMSFMTELFNKDRIKACSIPFDDAVYSKYLEQLVNCQISIGGYPKSFMNNLKILGNMVYPLLSKQTYSNNSGGQNYGGGYGNNFSPEMNNTLNQMRNKY